jgi:NIPSNAP
MYAQLRIYTINRGAMRQWLKLFNEKLRPIASLAGHTIIGPWISEAETEFIWIRVYESAEDAKTKDERFYGSPEWNAVATECRSLVAKSQVTVMRGVEAAGLRESP